MPDLKDNSFSADIIALKDINSSSSTSNIDKLIRIFSINNNNQKSESSTSSSNLKAVCSSNHESPLSFESSISFSKEKQKPQIYKQQQQNPLQNQSIRKSDNLLTFSPVTPIVDSSEPISDCTENNQLPEEKAQTATYKSIMIIDVFDKFYSSSSLASNQFCHQQHEQAPSQRTNLIIKNLNETISPTKVNMISNAINKHFNNFYLLNMSNNMIDNETSSYDEKKSTDNIGNNVFVYKNSIRLGDLNEKMNALAVKSDQDHQEKPDDDVKRCILLRNKHSNKILDYVSDERKIFSYDLSQFQNEDKNVIRKTSANNQKNSNTNLNKRKNLSEILNDLENSLRSSMSLNQFTLDCLNDDLSETNSIIELHQNDEDDIFNTINSSDSIKNNMYLINSHLSCSFSDTTSDSTASSSKSSCSSKSACSSQSSSDSSLSASSSRCSSRCSNGSSNNCNEKVNEGLMFLRDDNVAKSNQQSCRSTPTFLLINDFEKSTTGIDHSAEFARADDVISVMNPNTNNNNHEMYNLNHNKSSDDEFTYSELNCLSNYEDDMPRLLKIEKLTEEEEEEEEEVNADEENEIEIEKEQEEKSLFEILNVNVHRLPGELLGMNLRVEENGSVIVVNIIQNSAADRSSDSNGNRCSIRAKDEITEINGVSLSNMSNEEILSVVQELPLFVNLTIKRRSSSASPIPPMLTPTDSISKSNSKQKENSKLAVLSPNSSNLNLNEKIPPGYTLHNIYLSSMESKCIMPCDLKECNEVEGLYKIQRNTLQIGEEDHLKKGDILYTINDVKLEYKNKFDLISKLSSLDGIAEVCVLRKQNPTNCYTMMSHNVDENCNINVPYHNGIFAQNSIKLTMRKYDKPSCKSNSDLDFQHLPDSVSHHANQIKTPTTQSPSQTIKFEPKTIMEESEKLSNREDEKPHNEHELAEKTQHIQFDLEVNENENQDVNDENLKNENMEFMSCLNGQVLTSMHSDNWLLFCDRKTSHHQMNSVITATTTTRTTHNSLSLNENTHFVKSQEYSLSQFYQKDASHNEHNDEEDDDLETLDFNNFSPAHGKTTPTITTATGFMPTHATEQEDKQEIEHKIPGSFNIEDATMRSLTNSSCHSERSCVHLNCAFCGDEDEGHEEHVKQELGQTEKEKSNEEQDKHVENLFDVDEDNTSKILNQVDHLTDMMINEPCANEQEEQEMVLLKPSAIRIAPDVPSSSNSSISNKFVSTFQFQFNKDPNKKYKTQITFIKCEPDENNIQNNDTNHKDGQYVNQEMKIENDENEDEQKEANCQVLKECIEQQEFQEQVQENDSYLSETITTFNNANKTLNNFHSNDYYYCNKLNLNTSNDLTCSLFNTTNTEIENSMTQNDERNKEVHKLLNELLSAIEYKQNQMEQHQHEQSIKDKEKEEKEEKEIGKRHMDNSDVISSVLNEILEQVERSLVLKSPSESIKHDISEPTNSKSFADLKKMMHQELVHVMKSAKSPTSTTKTSDRNSVEELKVSRTPMDTLLKNKKAHYESLISLDNTNNLDLNSTIQKNLHCATVTTTVSPLADSTVSQFNFPSVNNFNTLTKCLESVIELKMQQHQEEIEQERKISQTIQIDQEDVGKNEIVTFSYATAPPPPPPPLPSNGESIFKTLNKKSFSKSNETLSMLNSENELRNYSKTTQNSKTINHEHKREFLKELQEKQQLIASLDLSSKFKLNTRFRNRKESSKTNLTERFNTLIPAARPYNTLKAVSNSIDSSEQKQHFSSKTLTLSFAKNRPTNKYKTQVRFSTLPNSNSNQNLTDSANKIEDHNCAGERVEVKIETKPESNGVGPDLADELKPQPVLKSEDHSNEESTSIDYVESAFDKQIKQRPSVNSQIKFQHPARLPLPNNNKSNTNSNETSQENKKYTTHSTSTNESMTVKDKIRLFTSASTSNTNNANKAANSTQNINSSFNDLTSMKPISIRKANRLADSLPSIYPFQIASSFVSSSTSDSTSDSMVHMNCAPSVLSTTTASFVNKFNANTNLRDFSARCLSTQTLSTNCNTQNSSSSTTTFLNLKAESCNQLNNQRGINKKNENQHEKGTIIYSNYSNNKTANNDQNDEKEKVKTFKSIKEKIAFFSSKANNEKETIPLSVHNVSQRHINTPNKLANRIEIVELNNNQVKSNSYEYDSLRYAYKLNQLTTFSTKSECDVSSLNKLTKASSIRLLTNNSSVKSILFDSNENKISELIANMETKIKQL